ncbi:MAG TPA: Gfo/Idh/MocA family oxidoreductase [Cyclobacteriaceae bacterium]|jgi:predicted dehydrogenase|nr:Gfo/Idh/MocA family oxidoreductase [Cyclobacteriaceae bacterium]
MRIEKGTYFVGGEKTNMFDALNIAVIGAGGFAHFATSEFIQVPGVTLAGIYDENRENALRLKQIELKAKIFDTLDELCRDPSIDLVYIATPPFLHYAQSKKALLAGKHVICEKPAAITLPHALELKNIASDRKLLFVVNLMQRYNKLYDAVRKLIEHHVLGDFLHGFFENYASDEFLTEQHWFWDEDKSGGIFIEHGVHFFDMFSGWLGDAKVIAAQKSNRRGFKNVWDRVQASVQYSGGCVHFYHGFDQPKAMDRQEMRLLFEKGEITLYEWVPTRLKMTALCDDVNLKTLRSIFPKASIETIEGHDEDKVCHGRFKEIKYRYKIKLDTGGAVEKQVLYQELVTAMFKDQLTWLKDREHVRKITDLNAVDSLRLAEEAESVAIKLQGE